jgi:hypothetical protein
MPIVTHQECDYCGGDGIYNGGTCPTCGGSGEVPIGHCTHAHSEWNIKQAVVEIDDALEKLDAITAQTDKLPADAVVFTYEVSDNTVVAEYNALSDAQKDNYNVILSMGIVDLSAGTTTRASLWSMFDSESTTRANLLTLIGE